jgi:hypothetical protein
LFGLFVSDEDKPFCKIDSKAYITKHYGLVMYEKMDILQCKLVFLLLTVAFTALDKHTSLLRNLCVMNL